MFVDYNTLSTAFAIGFRSSINSANFSGSKDWPPSLRASDGFAWTSIINPSAPAAIDALHIAGISRGLPVP